MAGVGVLGAGTMGTGIAQVAALGGYETRLYDPDAAAAENAEIRLGEALAKGLSHARWTELEAEEALDRVRTTTDLEDLAECELLIEAAPEKVELKRDLFGAVAAVCAPDSVFATNTSSLRVTDIAAGVPHPERLVGMHFFNPPALMKLVEVVFTADSAEPALEATVEVGRRMGRTPIRAKDSPGFIANRLARPYSLESLRMLGEGIAEAETIDRVARLGGGFRMGPFELIDLIGLDVNLSVARSFYSQGGEPARWKPSEIQERMVGEGRLGRKSGAGFYKYEQGVPHREEDPELGIIPPTLDRSELERIDPAAPEILTRLVAQIANEAAFALEEGVGSPDDMNTAMRLGFNWPLGPLEFTELIGPARAVEVLQGLREELGDAYSPAPGLTTKDSSST